MASVVPHRQRVNIQAKDAGPLLALAGIICDVSKLGRFR
jgi:hypothetical protein